MFFASRRPALARSLPEMSRSSASLGSFFKAIHYPMLAWMGVRQRRSSEVRRMSMETADRGGGSDGKPGLRHGVVGASGAATALL